MADDTIGYRITAVQRSTGGFATAAMATSMISGKVISSSGGGGFFITPEEFEVIRKNESIQQLIMKEANKPKPKVLQVVVSMEQDAEYEGVLTDLQALGFALKKRGVLGSTAFLVGEVFDTYLNEAQKVHGVYNIQLKDDINI